MTIAPQRPRSRPVDRDRRHALSAMVQDAIEALVAAEPAAVRPQGTPGQALARARATAEEGDGCGGRAAAGIRTAWAYLAAGQAEEAYFALECARDALITV